MGHRNLVAATAAAALSLGLAGMIVPANVARGDVIVAATHGILSGSASEKLARCGAREVIFTDTLPIPDAKRFPHMTVLPIAPLLAEAIHQVFEDGSVTSLFDGNA